MTWDIVVETERLLAALLYSSIAAACAALGALPFAARGRLPAAWLGWANAVAAGLMMGASYILVVEGTRIAPVAETLGAGLGVAVLYLTHALTGTTDLGTEAGQAPGAEYARKMVVRSVIHAAAEGVAIGAGMALDLRLGIFIALALAAHNVPEATALCAVLRARGAGLLSAAVRCVAARLGQVVLAALAFVLVASHPRLLAGAVGFPAGALLYLVVVELLPDSFEQAGHTTIAVLASVALGAVVLLSGFVV